MSTERHYGRVLGWIPYSRVAAWAAGAGYDREMVEVIWLVIHGMDSCYLDGMSTEHKRAVERMRQEGKSRARKPAAAPRKRGLLGRMRRRA